MAAISKSTAITTSTGFTVASRCSDLRADANWGSTRYSKTKTSAPTLKMMRTSRGSANRFFLTGSGIVATLNGGLVPTPNIVDQCVYSAPG